MTQPTNSATHNRPATLAELQASGWRSRSVKAEVRENFLKQLAAGTDLFPGILGYENTVIPEISLALLAGHDMLFLGEKGQGKSRMMRALPRFLDEAIPYLDLPGDPFHRQPLLLGDGGGFGATGIGGRPDLVSELDFAHPVGIGNPDADGEGLVGDGGGETDRGDDRG